MMNTVRMFRRQSLGHCVLVAVLAVTNVCSGWPCPTAQERPAPDVPLKRLYGFMVDAPRTPESLGYYRRLVDFCSAWGLNAIIFRLTDDQGAAIRFESHPEFLTHKNALTTDEVRKLVEYAHNRGIELIPEVESFGHSHYITGVRKYAQLVDNDPQTPDKRSPNFNGLIPSHPSVLRLMRDIYHEVATLFQSRYLHGGCDEVAWGGSEFSRQALQTKNRSEIWAQYVNSLDELARSLGKEFIIWGDHPLREDPKILGLLNKSVIIMDWNYANTDPSAIGTVARTALSNGLRVIGAPALMNCKWGPRAGSDQLRNIDAYAEAYREIDDPRCIGLIIANWTPSRYIQGSIWDGIAYAAVAIKEGSSIARQVAFRRFVEVHYGALWNDIWADVFQTYYDIAPNRKDCAPDWKWPILPTPWHNEEELVDVLKANSPYVPPFTRILSQLTFCEPLVRRNFHDFRSFRLSLEYFQELYLRDAVLVQEANAAKTNNEFAVLIRAIADRDRLLFGALIDDWDRGRPGDSPIKTQLAFDGPEDQLVFRFGQAAAFSADLARDPDRFYNLFRKAKHQSRLAKQCPKEPSGGPESHCE